MKKLTLLPILAIALLILPEIASATEMLEDVRDVLCAFVKAFTGNIAVAIATLAIIFLGIGAFFGKVNYGLCITVIVAIIVIFSAADIVYQIAKQSYAGAQKCF